MITSDKCCIYRPRPCEPMSLILMFDASTLSDASCLSVTVESLPLSCFSILSALRLVNYHAPKGTWLATPL